jgi:hypothetical protein
MLAKAAEAPLLALVRPRRRAARAAAAAAKSAAPVLGLEDQGGSGTLLSLQLALQAACSSCSTEGLELAQNAVAYIPSILIGVPYCPRAETLGGCSA